MLLYLILIFSAYFIFLLICISGWNKVVLSQIKNAAEIKETVTVIVPFRNEADNLPALLHSFTNQDCDRTGWEIILIDDHSTDSSSEIVTAWIHSHSDISASLIHAVGEGKKNALTEAMDHARGEIILTTDADCILPSNWISSMRNSFAHDTAMVVGTVRLKQSFSMFSSMQALEFSSLLGSGLAMIKLGFPVFCNGASLGYRKSAFSNVGGYADNLHIASGDDEFLMRKIFKHEPYGIKIISNLSATAVTKPLSSVSEYINQRLRWAGKWKYNSDRKTKLLALFILCFQVSYLLSVVLLFLSSHFETIFILLFIKWLMEGIFLFQVARQLSQSFSILAFLLLQIIYPVYVISIGVVSQFYRASWKERIIKI